MPWETTVCISQKWFYNTTDTIYKTPEELLQLYKIATAQDNILILDLPPDRRGKLRDKDIQLVLALRKLILEENVK
jgi:alpha-L-fucosidase